MRLVTVYGSLLSGMGNWKWFLNRPDCKLLGEHVLEVPLNMISLGGFPGVIPSEEVNKIFVETYEVPEEVYRHIEGLEGYLQSNPSQGMYDKMEVDTPFGKSEVYVYNSKAMGRYFVPADENGIINWKKYKLS